MKEFYAAQLRAQQIENETGISLADQAQMPLDEWSRLAYGVTPTEAALQALDAEFVPPGQPRQEAPAQTAPQPAPEPQGVDVASLDMATYAQLRGQLGVGRSRQEGVGLLNQQGTQSWAEAARAKSGRSGWQGRNVTESPRLDRVVVNERVDTRSAAERLSSPANFWTA